jgi:hypothetical protein
LEGVKKDNIIKGVKKIKKGGKKKIKNDASKKGI